MNGDTLTVGDTSDFEDYMRERVAEEASEEGAVAVALGPSPGLLLHEAAVLLVSGAVVALHGVHGALGLLPGLLGLLGPHLLLGALALLCAYLCSVLWHWSRASSPSSILQLQRSEADAKDESEVEEEAPEENIVSAQLEKEERVQRWINNLYSNRDQVNLEACGEIKGRNMEADVSCAELLGDGQALPPLPPPPAPRTLQVDVEGRRALSLAYELSVAVRNQQANEIRATLSAPDTQRALGLSLLPQDHDHWKVVSLSGSGRQPEAARQADSKPQPQPQEPQSESEAEAEGARTPTAVAADPLTTSSLLNFMRRFSGTRFLYGQEEVRAPAPAPAPAPVPAPAPAPAPVPAPATAPAPAPEACRKAEPPNLMRRSCSASQTGESEMRRIVRTAGGGATTTEASTSVDPPERRDPILVGSNHIMKVFSKGLLSEGVVDISATSIQTDANTRSAAADQLMGAGALSLPAQEAVLLRARTSTASGTDRSSLNLSSPRSRVHMEDAAPPTTTRGLTVNMSDDGLARRMADTSDTDHKSSLFDLRKSLLSSIPEAAPPDEDFTYL